MFAAVLRSRRALASRRLPRRTELIWIVIPVVVVLFLAARSWIIALDLGSPAVATVAPVKLTPPLVDRYDRRHKGRERAKGRRSAWSR